MLGTTKEKKKGKDGQEKLRHFSKKGGKKKSKIVNSIVFIRKGEL